MKSLFYQRLKSQQGAAVVEFVLVVPLLLLLLFGIVEFSLIMYNKHILTNASREGARFGIVVTDGGPRHSESEIEQVIKDWAKTRLITFGSNSLTNSAIILEHWDQGVGSWQNFNPTGRIFGDKLKVRIQYGYDFLLLPNIPVWGVTNNISQILTLDAQTVMNYE